MWEPQHVGSWDIDEDLLEDCVYCGWPENTGIQVSLIAN